MWSDPVIMPLTGTIEVQQRYNRGTQGTLELQRYNRGRSSALIGILLILLIDHQSLLWSWESCGLCECGHPGSWTAAHQPTFLTAFVHEYGNTHGADWSVYGWMVRVGAYNIVQNLESLLVPDLRQQVCCLETCSQCPSFQSVYHSHHGWAYQ